MKFLSTTYSSSVSYQPLSAPSLEFVQNGTKELALNLAKSIIETTNGPFAPASLSVPYVLWGCVAINFFGSYIISAGAILYQGEVYTVPIYSTTLGTGIFNAHITTFNSPSLDPTQFSDFATHNVHNDRYISWTQDSAYVAVGPNDFPFTSLSYTTDVPSQITTEILAASASMTSYVNYSGWATPTILNGWNNGTLVRLAKSDRGDVTMQGLVNISGSAPTSDIFMTLPSFAKPSRDLYIPSFGFDAATGDYHSFTIKFSSTSGNAEIQSVTGFSPTASTSWFVLDGIHYIIN
jgi:hypothetical protein